ncbi:hypothetical protein G9A89_010472 [Geosiphon pyriformis]|nr:hypothetical protein G9A89_010472 [Geosiphon pyriformis]
MAMICATKICLKAFLDSGKDPSFLKQKHIITEPIKKRNLFTQPFTISSTNDESSVNFVKEIIEDENVLHELASNAAFAWRASCQQVIRTNEEFSLRKEIWAHDWFSISEYTARNLWDVIPYPHVEDGYVLKTIYWRWERDIPLFWEKLKGFEMKNKLRNSLTFTGFGYGAAFAVLAALEYKRMHLEASITLITFGQPRVGDELFVHYTEHLLQKVWRVTYGDDWMPNFPIEGLDRGKRWLIHQNLISSRVMYRHFQKEIWIEPQCDCSNPKFYFCFHTVTLHEHEECNARKHFHRITYPGTKLRDSLNSYKKSHPDDDHYGPYFGHTMLQNCPQF